MLYRELELECYVVNPGSAIIPKTLTHRYNGYGGSVCLNQKSVRNEGTDAAWVRPPGLQP